MLTFIEADSNSNTDPQLLNLYLKSLGEISSVAPQQNIENQETVPSNQIRNRKSRKGNWELYFNNILSDIDKLELLTNQIHNIPEDLGQERKLTEAEKNGLLQNFLKE